MNITSDAEKDCRKKVQTTRNNTFADFVPFCG